MNSGSSVLLCNGRVFSSRDGARVLCRSGQPGGRNARLVFDRGDTPRLPLPVCVLKDGAEVKMFGVKEHVAIPLG